MLGVGLNFISSVNQYFQKGLNMNAKLLRSLVFYLFVATCFSSSIVGAKESLTDLDTYLQARGYYLSPAHSNINEGYCSIAQRRAYRDALKKHPEVKTIAEIGFNGGHSVETFFEALDKVKILSFDINWHPYTPVGVEFMQKKYVNRFEFIPGDSGQTVKAYSESHPDVKFDLIYIDGCHEYAHAIADIYNCQKLAHRNTIVWIDDYAPYGVQAAVDYCIDQGLIRLVEAKRVDDDVGPRAWAEVRYNYVTEAEKAFGDIYRESLWGVCPDGLSSSGPGSTLEQGWPFIQYLQSFLNEHNDVKTVVDLGCGDWVLAREIDWGSRNYIGIEVVPELVDRNQAAFGSDKVRFVHLDAGYDTMPAGDLLICKDVLMHLPNAIVAQILEKSKKYKYCIFVNDFNSADTRNIDVHTSGFRFLDLTKKPFNLEPFNVNYYVSDIAYKQILLVANN